MCEAQKMFSAPPLEAPGGGQNANCKFKTFGLLNTLKVQIQSSYFTSTTLSSNKTSRKISRLIFLCSLLFRFRFKSVIALISEGGGKAPPLQVKGALHPLPLSLVYALECMSTGYILERRIL